MLSFNPEPSQQEHIRPWYARPSRLLLMLLVLFLFTIGIRFIVLFASYYRDLRQGKTPALPERPNQLFTRAYTQSPPVQKETLGEVITLDDPSLGNPDASLTIVEFGDFECPFCQKAYPIVRGLLAKYPDRIHFVYRDFPVQEIHEYAIITALAGECAHEQQKFWPLHDKLFQNQNALTREDILRYATQSGLNMKEFTVCLDSKRYAKEVEEDFNAGIAAGVVGTPTFFVNGQKVEGVVPFEVWEKIVKQFEK